MRYLFFPLVVLIISCGTGSAGDSAATDSAQMDGTVVDTANTPPDTTAGNPGVNTPAPEGVYQVRLPCAGCPGIEHTVAFHQDLSFRMQEERFGKGGGITTGSGRWRPNNGVIELYRENSLVGQYRWEGDTLVYLQGDKSYPTYKRSEATTNEAWKRKKEEGVTYFGVGNEPFWNVEIKGDQSIAFHLAEWGAPRRFRGARPLVSTDSTVYVTGGDTARLQVTVYPHFCSDGMSDYVYDHRVKVVFKGQVYRGCGIKF